MRNGLAFSSTRQIWEAGGRKGRRYGAGARRAGSRRCGTGWLSRPRVRSGRLAAARAVPTARGHGERGRDDAERVGFLVHASDLGGWRPQGPPLRRGGTSSGVATMRNGLAFSSTREIWEAGGRKGRRYGAGARRAGSRRCGTGWLSRPRVRSGRLAAARAAATARGHVERGRDDAERVGFLVHASDLGGRAAARAAPTARGPSRRIAVVSITETLILGDPSAGRSVSRRLLSGRLLASEAPAAVNREALTPGVVSIAIAAFVDASR